MADVRTGRWMAQIDGDFVVFILGARPQRFHLLRSLRDLGGRRGMPYMLKKLSEDPENGLLGYEIYGLGTIVLSGNLAAAGDQASTALSGKLTVDDGDLEIPDKTGGPGVPVMQVTEVNGGPAAAEPPKPAGPPFAQSQIVLRGSALIAVAFDRNDPRRVLLQHRGVRLQRGAAGIVHV